ncbi:unnamed protein product [Cunninghamella echinulata]
METTAVRVALRTRPLSPKELEVNGTHCITYVKDEPQILLGTDCSFTFDFTFSPKDTQQYVFETCIIPLLDCFMDGNNATVLAYGQTATGKSYSLGTSIESFGDKEAQGMVQRFAYTLFDRLENNNKNKTKKNNYQLYVSFMELYNEELLDLLSSTKKEEQTHPAIHEDIQGHIYCTGLKEVCVNNAMELLDYLRKGSLSRATGSTDMNVSSSRSHAIFTITLKQQQTDDDNDTNNGNLGSKRLVSKFHFVDLAGSERLKRTNALGERQKEGISINTGLLALGNVISALGDESRRCSHIPYRDSKLTRLLQDSLGGNSHTLMLACISPSITDYTETLNTLKYANRARNIQNRVEINVDYEGSPEELTYLRNQLVKLKMQLSSTYRRSSTSSISTSTSSQHNNHLLDDHKFLKSELTRVKAYASLLAQDLAHIQGERDTLLLQQQQQQQQKSNNNNNIIEANPLIVDYLKQIETLKFELGETKNQLIELESRKQDNYPYQHVTSTSMALPGKYGGRSDYTNQRSYPSSRKSSISLEKHFRSGTHSTGGRGRTVRQRKHSLPIRQRMKTAMVNNQYNLATPIPSLDETWHFLDTNNDDMMEYPSEVKYPQVIPENTIKCQKSQAYNEPKSHKENNTIDDKMIPSYSPDADLMLHSTQPDLHSFKFDILTSFSSTLNSTLPDTPISAKAVCQDLLLSDDEEVESLSVPAWNDEPKTQPATISTKRESLSWTDSLLDDSDNSMTTSRLSSIYWETASGIKKSGRRRSKDVLKMLHQIQADLLVKKELVGQLEKSEDEYTQMRMNYEEQLLSLQNHLVDMQHQRDSAIVEPYHHDGELIIDDDSTNPDHPDEHMKLLTDSPKMMAQNKKNPLTLKKSSKTPTRHSPSPPSRNRIQQQQQQQQQNNYKRNSILPLPPQQQLESKSRQVKEIRLQYESKLKRLSIENQEWKRKFTQTTNNMNLARSKAEQVVTGLRHTIDQLKMEKKQLQRSMKQENEKWRSQLQTAEMELQQYKRKETIFIESKKKWIDTHEEQQSLLKKRNDYTLQVNQQMRQLTLALRKAATEGVFLNEVTLERILSQASSSSSSPSPSSPSSPTTTMMIQSVQR